MAQVPYNQPASNDWANDTTGHGLGPGQPMELWQMAPQERAELLSKKRRMVIVKARTSQTGAYTTVNPAVLRTSDQEPQPRALLNAFLPAARREIRGGVWLIDGASPESVERVLKWMRDCCKSNETNTLDFPFSAENFVQDLQTANRLSINWNMLRLDNACLKLSPANFIAVWNDAIDAREKFASKMQHHFHGYVRSITTVRNLVEIWAAHPTLHGLDAFWATKQSMNTALEKAARTWDWSLDGLNMLWPHLPKDDVTVNGTLTTVTHQWDFIKALLDWFAKQVVVNGKSNATSKGPVDAELQQRLASYITKWRRQQGQNLATNP